MLDTDLKARLNQPVELVFIRSTKTKKNDESKLRKYEPGESEIVIRKYADELISMHKAVVKGSPAHKQWLEYQKTAPKKNDNADLKKELAETKEALAQAQEEIKKLSKK